jgi:hypothetical protein
MATDDLSSYLPYLRLSIGDITEGSYRYTDEWLTLAMVAAVQALSSWWYKRYLLDTNNEVYRNPSIQFEFSEPPVIQIGDERPIILMAGIIVLEGSLENSAWDLGSWKDTEVSFSNIESGRVRDKRLVRMYDELHSILLPPNKKLAWAIKGSLPGYKNNEYETDSKY